MSKDSMNSSYSDDPNDPDYKIRSSSSDSSSEDVGDDGDTSKELYQEASMVAKEVSIESGNNDYIGGDNMDHKVVGKGSAVQENLLPGTGKEMVSMYHCNDFKNCTQVQAKHYCAKQNQPELVLDVARSDDTVIVMACNMNTALCNSGEGHVHMIKHELSQDSNHLKTTYTIYSNGKYEKDSIYHFNRRQ